PRLALRHGREADSGGEHALLEQLARELVRESGLADDHGGDRRLADAGIETGRCEALLEVARVLPKTVDTLGLLLENVEGGETRRGDGRGVRGREEERARAVVEELDQVAAAADVAAEDADRLRERADLNVNTAVESEMVDGAAAVASEDARGVRVVHHHDGAVALAGFDEAGQRANVAGHEAAAL